MSSYAVHQCFKRMHTRLSVVVQTQAHTFIPCNILVNAPSLGADCFPRVVETPWLHSVTPPPFTIAPQQWLFNKLLVRKETTLFKIQMTRQRESFLSHPGVGGMEGGDTQRLHTEPFVVEDF